MSICPQCGGHEKSVTPIMAYCQACRKTRQTDVAHLPPQPAPPRPVATAQAVYSGAEKGSCPKCGGPERPLSPLLVTCQFCHTTRNPWNEPVPDRQAEQRLRVELLSLGQQLRTKGVPRLEAIRMQARMTEVEAQIAKCPN